MKPAPSVRLIMRSYSHVRNGQRIRACPARNSDPYAEALLRRGAKTSMQSFAMRDPCQFVAFAQIFGRRPRTGETEADQLAVASMTLAEAADTAPGSIGSFAGRTAPG